MGNLLRKALDNNKHPKGVEKVASDDEVKLAIAYMTGRIRLTDANVALSGKPTGSGSNGYKMARALRDAYRQGKIKLV